MPKARLTFTLPEEQIEHYNAVFGSAYRHVLSDLDEFLRGKGKYPAEQDTDKMIEAYKIVRDTLWDLIREENLDL